jgi:hydrogenase nickel incorporation protein HypA/HybF
MHELSIALQIVEGALQSLTQEDGRPTAVHVRIGALAGVVPDALHSAWECARGGSPLAAAELMIEEVPATLWCSICNCERAVQSLQRFCCADCGSTGGELVRGRELEIVALEVANDDATR